MPRVAPPGPGGRPGRSTQPADEPKLGATTFRRDLTIVSNPIHPDNNHQTIIQPASPPDLIIKQDLKLPNVVFGNPLAKPKVPLQDVAAAVKPNAMAPRTVEDVTAPQTSVTDPSLKLTSLASMTKPKAPLQDVAAAVKPNAMAPRMVEDVTAPQASTADPNLRFTSLAPTTQQPRLPVPLGLAPGAVPAASAASAAAGGGLAGEANPGEPNGLLIMGTDPMPGGASISLPPGNRFGAFSSSPAGGGPGSPGGIAAGAGGGTGGSGAGGDESTGIGGGRSGGGGGSLTSGAVPISVTGTGALQGNRGNVEALLARGAIFPVISLPHIRRNALIISAGGVGGGGLGIYQALQCGRIYTVFLPMPSANWTLQYCQQDGSESKPNPSAGSRVIKMESGLLPPDAVEKYDFRRMAVPPDKSKKMIVLKGTIREDGAVDNLNVYQGVLKEMDEIALAAFSKWKFNPAKRGGKTVAVQILVGIQLTNPAAQ